MRLVSRRPRAAAGMLVLGAVVAGCGGSLADADTPTASRATTTRQSPFCAAVQANSEAIRPLNGLARNGAEPANLTAMVEAVRFTGGDLVNSAPADLRADVQRTVDAVNLQLDALVAAGGNATEAGSDPALAAQLNSPELAAASRRVGTYVAENCPTTTR